MRFLFGCSSFDGLKPEAYADAFALLRARHLAPRRWLPRVKAPLAHRFAEALRRRRPSPAAAARTMPPLLRSYLALGGRVSDHAVVDRDLGTMDVFTGLEVADIPPALLRSLRAIRSARVRPALRLDTTAGCREAAKTGTAISPRGDSPSIASRFQLPTRGRLSCHNRTRSLRTSSPA